MLLSTPVRLFLTLILGFILIKSQWCAPIIEACCIGIAKVLFGVLSLAGENVQIQNNIVAHLGIDSGVIVIPPCLAPTYCLVLISFALCFNAPITSRVLLAFGGIAVIQVVNIVRMLSILYLQPLLSDERMHLYHEQLWPFLTAVITATLIIQWVKKALLFNEIA